MFYRVKLKHFEKFNDTTEALAGWLIFCCLQCTFKDRVDVSGGYGLLLSTYIFTLNAFHIQIYVA